MKNKKIIITIAIILLLGFTLHYLVKIRDSQNNTYKCGDDICGEKEMKNPNLCPADCETKLESAFIVIHMEVGGTPKTLDYQEEMWPTLVELIELADRYDLKLTLEFNPQWATYILEEQSRLTLIRNWERNGHEIALHHHGATNKGWNGYSDEESKKTDPSYIGSIQEMMDVTKQLPLSGRIYTGGVTDEETDWPEELIYDTNGGAEEKDLLSNPTPVKFNNFEATQLTYRAYSTGNPSSASLQEIERSYYLTADRKIMGIAFHARDYSRTPQSRSNIEELFASLNKHDIKISTVKSILSQN